MENRRNTAVPLRIADCTGTGVSRPETTASAVIVVSSTTMTPVLLDDGSRGHTSMPQRLVVARRAPMASSVAASTPTTFRRPFTRTSSTPGRAVSCPAIMYVCMYVCLCLLAQGYLGPKSAKTMLRGLSMVRFVPEICIK